MQLRETKNLIKSTKEALFVEKQSKLKRKQRLFLKKSYKYIKLYIDSMTTTRNRFF